VVDNGSSDDTIAWLKRHNYEVLRNKKNVGVFHATRRVWLEAHSREYEFILNLQNDFPACHPIPLDDIFLLFETYPKIGFVQLNNKKYLWTHKGRKRVLKIKRRTHNSCTKSKIKGKNVICGSSKFFISNHHFSFNPNFFPCKLVPKLVGKVRKPRERQIMEQFEKTKLKAARTRRRCFETVIRKREGRWKR